MTVLDEERAIAHLYHRRRSGLKGTYPSGGHGSGWTVSAHVRQSHPEIIKRLRRAEGHLRSIVGMIEAGRPCVDIAQQLHAVEKAVSQAKKTLIQDHIDHCLEEAVGPLDRAQRGPVAEFKAITKYL